MTIHSTAENIVNEVAYLERMEKAGVPEHLRDGLVSYLVHHLPPGHFLTAVLENNLREAFARADSESRDGMYQLILFLYNDFPSTAWGSPERVGDWIERGPS